MKVAILGANGRMGRVLIEALRENDDADLSVATVRDDSPWVGIDVGELAGIGTQGIACSAISSLNPDDVDVVIDFTLPAAFDSNLAWCTEHKKPVVIGVAGPVKGAGRSSKNNPAGFRGELQRGRKRHAVAGEAGG